MRWCVLPRLVALANLVAHRATRGFSLPLLVLMLVLIFGPWVARRARLPGTVGLVIVGMLVGPHGVRLLHGNEISLQAWGTFGLLYLMFAAALELDLRRLAEMKAAAITFALLSFAIPFTLGFAGAKLLGFRTLGAVLMGANWGSHTLVTYPTLRDMGLARNRAVATVVGATTITDTTALLVLAAVSFRVRRAGSLELAGVTVGAGLAILALWTLVVLPKIARWFFAQVGAARSHRVIFGMAAFLSGAVLAEATDIDGIIGAFFAGIGMARVIPERSALMERVQFFGSALFIPTFLVSVGVLLEPRVLIVPRTLLVSAVLIVAVLGGKTLAAVIAGRLFRFTWAEVGLASGLSGTQAAATLATTLVGAHLGVFDHRDVNAVLIVVLVTLVVTPIIVNRFARKIPHPEDTAEPIGKSVIVLVTGERTRPLLHLAARFAAADGGIVVATTIAMEEATPFGREAQHRLAERADEWLANEGFESRPIFRVASSLDAGLRDTILAEAATVALLEWTSTAVLPRHIRRLAKEPPIPILLVHEARVPFTRLLVIAPREELASEAGRSHVALATEVATRLATKESTIGFVGPDTPKPTDGVTWIRCEDPLDWIRDNVVEGDCVIFSRLDAARAVPHLDDATSITVCAPNHSITSSRARDLELVDHRGGSR